MTNLTNAESHSGGFAGARAPFPFVVGCSRSGTTLLRAMLDAHPQLAVPPESHFVVAQDGVSGRRLVRGLRRDPWFALWDLELPALGAGVVYADAVRAVFASYAARQGKPRYADKTPHYVSHLPTLARRFEEARFVHVVRDGRDVASSLVGVPWGPDTVEAAAAVWRRRVLEGRTAGLGGDSAYVGGTSGGGGLGPDRYREIRYEALVAEPESGLRALAAWLDLPYDDAMLAYPGRTLVVPYAELHARLGLAPTPGLRDWRRDMTPKDVARFEAVAGDALDVFGYARATDAEP